MFVKKEYMLKTGEIIEGFKVKQTKKKRFQITCRIKNKDFKSKEIGLIDFSVEEESIEKAISKFLNLNTKQKEKI